MSYCVLPGCVDPENPDSAKFCHSCGSKLLLRERYRPLQLLGRGGFGRTFLARDEDIPSRPTCVVKQLCFEGQSAAALNKATELFRQEAVRLDDLGQHAQIPTLLAHFEQDCLLYLVQEWVEGKTLEQTLETQGCFSEAEIWELLQDLLMVLQYVHERDVIHRDIKPANIIHRQRDRKPVLIDFGVAKLITASALQNTGTTVGSLEYMAPEQSRGKALPASDLYSLGVTCIHLLTQVSPLDLFDIQENRWGWRNALPPSNSVSDRLAELLDTLLQGAVSQRYQSAREVLRVVKRGRTASPLLSSRQTRSQSWAGSQRTVSGGKVTQPAALAQPQTQVKPGAQQPRSAPARKKSPLSLVSARGVDYRRLRDLLAAAKWQDADRETGAALCLAAGKLSGAYFSSGDFKKCACEDLQIVDELWRRYSGKRFGFSVQSAIYLSVGEDYGSFCDRVAWPAHNAPNLDRHLQFKRSAPKGHLPSRIWVGGTQWWKHIEFLAAKLTQCGIC